jgi:poly(U)-specific endoribonuclease
LNSFENCRLLRIDEKVKTLNIVEKMKSMYNNYEQDTSINEYVLPIERKEENDFIDAVLATPVMRCNFQFISHTRFLLIELSFYL